MAVGVSAVGRDFHEEHIVLVTAIEAVGIHYVGHGRLAVFVAKEEEVDKHRLTIVKDAIKVDFVAVNIGASEVRDDVAAARGSGDRFLDHCTKVAVRVDRNSINHVFRVGCQFSEGVREHFLGREAVGVEVFRKGKTRQGHPLLHFALGGQQVVIGGAVSVRREGGSHLGLHDLIDGDGHLRVVGRSIAVMLLDTMLFQGADNSLGVVDGPKVLDDDGTVGHDKDNSGIGRYVIHA